MLRGSLLAVLVVASCSRASVTTGPEHLVQSVEHEGLRLEVTNHRVDYERSSGFTGAGRGVDWASHELRCGVDWKAVVLVDGVRQEAGRGSHVISGADCDAAATSVKLEACSGAGRIAFRDDRFFDIVLRFDNKVFVGRAWLGESGGTCQAALAESWDAATLLAHSRAPKALDALLRSSAATAAVRAFLDYDSWEVGTSMAATSVPEVVARMEQDSDEVHIRFLRAVHQGAARTPDLEAALYEFLAQPSSPEPYPLQWNDSHVQRALAFAPSPTRRRAYLERAMGQCAAVVKDPLRSGALAEALAQLGDAALIARAKAACPGLVVPNKPAWVWVRDSP